MAHDPQELEKRHQPQASVTELYVPPSRDQESTSSTVHYFMLSQTDVVRYLLKHKTDLFKSWDHDPMTSTLEQLQLVVGQQYETIRSYVNHELIVGRPSKPHEKASSAPASPKHSPRAQKSLTKSETSGASSPTRTLLESRDTTPSPTSKKVGDKRAFEAISSTPQSPKSKSARLQASTVLCIWDSTLLGDALKLLYAHHRHLHPGPMLTSLPIIDPVGDRILGTFSVSDLRGLRAASAAKWMAREMTVGDYLRWVHGVDVYDRLPPPRCVDRQASLMETVQMMLGDGSARAVIHRVWIVEKAKDDQHVCAPNTTLRALMKLIYAIQVYL